MFSRPNSNNAAWGNSAPGMKQIHEFLCESYLLQMMHYEFGKCGFGLPGSRDFQFQINNNLICPENPIKGGFSVGLTKLQSIINKI